MERDRVKSVIGDIKSGLSRGAFASASEADVCRTIVQRLLEVLNWNVYDISEVKQEYSLDRSSRVDFALFDKSGRTSVLIEVKAVGKIDIGGEQQLFNYAFHSGVQIVILTDGREWHFYTPMEAGNYTDRRFYKLDLVQHDIDDCVDVFIDFLFRDSVVSEKALVKAKEIIKSGKTNREIKETLPKAWIKVFAEAKDSYLADELREAVASICGHTPQESDIKSFLDGEFEKIKQNDRPTIAPVPKRQFSPPITSGTKKRFSPPKTDRLTHVSDIMSLTQIDRLAKVLSELANLDSSFLPRFQEKESVRNRNRKLVGRSLEELYPNAANITSGRLNHVELPGGWYMAKNMSAESIKGKIKLALELSNTPASEFGSEFSQWLSERS